MKIFFFIFLMTLMLMAEAIQVDRRNQQQILLQLEQTLSELPGIGDLPGISNLPGLNQDIINRSLGKHTDDSNIQTYGYAPNIDINKLLPFYAQYVGGKVTSELNSITDLSTLPIQPVLINFKSQRLLMPADSKLKIGDGFDVDAYTARASPFFLAGISQKGVSSDDGSDGEVSIVLATTAKELADSLSVSASAWGSGWGVDVKASFSYSKDYKMKSNEVVLMAKHSIDLGKALVDPSKFILTDEARRILATNSQAFKETYGSHFIAGYTSGCELNVLFRKTVSEKEDKTTVAASLEASYSGLAFSGGVSVSTSFSKEQKEMFESTVISISYTGANNNAFISNIDPITLNKAVLSFPEDCKGNFQNMILWPYESAQSFVFVANEVELILQQSEVLEQMTKLKQLQEKLKQQNLSQEEIVKQLANSFDQFNKDQEKKVEEQQETLQQEVQKAKDFVSGMNMLDELFTKAILEAKIITVGLEDEMAAQEKPTKAQEEKLLQSKLFQVQMNFDYKKYQKEYEDMQTKGLTKDYLNVEQFLGNVKSYVQDQRKKMIA